MSDLTKQEAYQAMYSFLESVYEMNKSDDIASLLGAMSMLHDGKTADPAIWQDWENSIKKVKTGSVDVSLRLK
ncbi:MAG: hypothetical protein GC149_07435 [Gammaproteobacteria bacterium]|nr:hypothetical protein [Gammaproteobacteria bacterium]